MGVSPMTRAVPDALRNGNVLKKFHDEYGKRKDC
jgi:hypothetical protein